MHDKNMKIQYYSFSIINLFCLFVCFIYSKPLFFAPFFYLV